MPRYNKNLDRGLDEDGSRSYRGNYQSQHSAKLDSSRHNNQSHHNFNNTTSFHKHNRSDLYGLGGQMKHSQTFEDDGEDDEDKEDGNFFERPKSKGFGSYGPALTERTNASRFRPEQGRNVQQPKAQNMFPQGYKLRSEKDRQGLNSNANG